MAVGDYTRDALLSDLGDTPAPTTPAVGTSATSQQVSRKPEVALRSSRVFDAKGVELKPASVGGAAPPVPDGGYVIESYTDGSTVRYERAPDGKGNDSTGRWKMTTGPVNPTTAQAFKDSLSAYEKAKSAEDLRQAQTDKLNAATADIIPAQKAALEAKTAEQVAQNAARAKNPQGLSPSEQISAEANALRKAQQEYDQGIDKIKQRLDEGKFNLEQAKQAASDLQNKKANDLAAEQQKIERERISSEESRAGARNAVDTRGQDLGFAGSMASTIGRSLEAERATQLTPVEVRNLAKARNYMTNPGGPAPEYEAPTDRLPGMKQQIIDMVNSILAPVSPAARAATGGPPAAGTGGITMPPPVAQPPPTYPAPGPSAPPAPPPAPMPTPTPYDAPLPGGDPWQDPTTPMPPPMPMPAAGFTAPPPLQYPAPAFV